MGIVSIPHSGEVIPQEFKNYLSTDLRAIAEDVDYKVDELVDISLLNQAGIIVLVSHIHRTCIDLNRSEDLAICAWPHNSKGIKIVDKAPTQEQKEAYLAKYHRPYFLALKSSIEKLALTMPVVPIIDLHSMPSKPTEYHLKITPDQPRQRPAFCVSDIEGKSCSKDFIDKVCNDLSEQYQPVTQNIPYYGGHITRWINSNFQNKNNIQIEISREIYMDEIKKELIESKVEKLKPFLTKTLIKQFTQ